MAATDPGLREMLEEHMRLGSTPMSDVYRDRAPIYVPDLRRESRWPAYDSAVRQTLGIHTLYILPHGGSGPGQRRTGPVCESRRWFDHEDKAVADILLAHAAAALADAVGQLQLRAALDSRTVIGQATGIVMERFDLDPQCRLRGPAPALPDSEPQAARSRQSTWSRPAASAETLPERPYRSGVLALAGAGIVGARPSPERERPRGTRLRGESREQVGRVAVRRSPADSESRRHDRPLVPSTVIWTEVTGPGGPRAHGER